MPITESNCQSESHSLLLSTNIRIIVKNHGK